MAMYAVVDLDNNVVNIVDWDGISDWSHPENTQLILVTDETGRTAIGAIWDGTIFNLPEQPPIGAGP